MRARPLLLKDVASVGMVIYGKGLPGGDGVLLLLRTQVRTCSGESKPRMPSFALPW